MSDPERIDVLLEIIEFYWKQYPHMNLMRLLHNALSLQNPAFKDFYYASDTQLIKALCEMSTKLEELDKN